MKGIQVAARHQPRDVMTHSEEIYVFSDRQAIVTAKFGKRMIFIFHTAAAHHCRCIGLFFVHYGKRTNKVWQIFDGMVLCNRQDNPLLICDVELRTHRSRGIQIRCEHFTITAVVQYDAVVNTVPYAFVYTACLLTMISNHRNIICVPVLWLISAVLYLLYDNHKSLPDKRSGNCGNSSIFGFCVIIRPY